MSGFGRPPGALTFSPTPPERGSFPLDHDGECKHIMETYLACIKRTKGNNHHECRMIAKDYLKCRMDRQLMAPDSFKNLGFHEQEVGEVKEMKGGTESRLDQLRRENAELVRKREAEEAREREARERK